MISNKDLLSAMDAFLVLGKMTVIDEEVAEYIQEDALNILREICKRNKVTIEQLGEAVKKIDLAAGDLPDGVDIHSWNHYAMEFIGDKICVFVNKKPILSFNDQTHKTGVAGFGSGFNKARFANIKINSL